MNKHEEKLREEFYGKFAVWNQKYKFAEKPCQEHKDSNCFCDTSEWTPPDVFDWFRERTVSKEAIENWIDSKIEEIDTISLRELSQLLSPKDQRK